MTTATARLPARTLKSVSKPVKRPVASVAKKPTPAHAEQAKQALVSTMLRQLRSDAEALSASADRLLSRLS